MKISILGVSRSGKTCYISAMSQILKNCKFGQGFQLSVKENDPDRQLVLDDNFMNMVTACRWPKNTGESSQYDFRLSIHDANETMQLPSLLMDDYRGGILTGLDKSDIKARNNFIASLQETAVTLFLIDGVTLLNAMDELDKDPIHRGMVDPKDKLDARNQITILENIIHSSIGNNHIPPMMLVITKSDVFVSETEYNNAIILIKQLLSELFCKGNQIFIGITKVSLGKNLGKGDDDSIIGNLEISTANNIHLPMLFAIYAYLDSLYDQADTATRKTYDSIMKNIRVEFGDKVQFYSNGVEAYAV